MTGDFVPNKQYVYDELNRLKAATMRSRRYWSFATNSATVTVTTLSATAAVLAQIEKTRLNLYIQPQDAATVLSLIVTIVAAIQTKLGFERKWVASRTSQSALCQLKIDAETGLAESEIATKLKMIINQHDQSVIGK